MIMVVGAGALFLTNILIRTYGSSELFQSWSYISTYLTLFFSFSVLGAEQLIIRFSTYTAGTGIMLTRATAMLFFVGAIAFILLFLFLLNGRIFTYEFDRLNAIVIIASISVLQAFYQKNRLTGANALGQFAFNLWRVILFVVIGALLYLQTDFDLERTVAVILVSSAIIAYLSSGYKMKWRIQPEYKGEFGVFVALSISLLSMSILGLLDRYMIESAPNYTGLSFEDYFYLITLVVFPFNMLSSYIGYVTARRFKIVLSHQDFINLSSKVMSAFALLAVLWCGILVLYSDWLSMPYIDLVSWALLVLLVVVRGGYAVMSAAITVRASSRHIMTGNVISLIAFAAITYVSVNYATQLEHILSAYTLAWVVRYVAFGHGLKEAYS